ncbi:MAG: amidase [Gemmatimonadales bacterium]
MPTNPADFGLREAVRAVARKRLSPSELAEAALARVAALNPSLNALITVTADSALATARRQDAALSRGRKPGALTGIPLTVKDLILTREAPTTLGSRVIPDGLPAGEDATVVARLRRAGAVIIGKANLHEVALGVTSENEHFGAVRNPWNRTRVAGGSSGGSAAAVAVGMGLGSVGTDTRGSIRIPASCCGITGLKPTFGLIPTEGVFPLAATLDHVGPMTRSAEDAALLFGVMAGGSWQQRALAAVDRPPRRPRIAVVDYFFEDADPAVAKAVVGAIRVLERGGAVVVGAEVPELEPALEASRVIVLAEAISYHDPLLRQRRRGYGPKVRARMVGGYRLSALQLVRAEETRAELVAAYHRLFAEVDCLVAPVLPVPPGRIGTESALVAGHRIPISAAYCRANAPQNLTGFPSLAVPCGQTADGLPIGLQIVTAPGRDDLALGIGARLQALSDWHRRRPPV